MRHVVQGREGYGSITGIRDCGLVSPQLLRKPGPPRGQTGSGEIGALSLAALMANAGAEQFKAILAGEIIKALDRVHLTVARGARSHGYCSG